MYFSHCLVIWPIYFRSCWLIGPGSCFGIELIKGLDRWLGIRGERPPEIDFVDNLMGQSFQIRNPNAVASCGCGTSFSVA